MTMNSIKKTEKSNTAPTAGLSKFHRSIVASVSRRQRCVSGQYPLYLTITDNPTRKWLSSGSSTSSKFSNSAATSEMLVNGTSVDKSLASFDRFQWLDDEERGKLQRDHALLSLELIAEINVKKPGYVHILSASGAGSSARKRGKTLKSGGWINRWKHQQIFGVEAKTEQELREQERLWITGFSLTKQSGEVHYMDVATGFMGQINARTAEALRWPNEVNYVPHNGYSNFPSLENFNKEDAEERVDDSLLVSDGFLVPGRDNGGVYIVSKPGHKEAEWKVCLTGGNGMEKMLTTLNAKASVSDDGVVDEEGWFYHRSIWIDITNDGRQSILTARAKRPSILNNTKNNNTNKSDTLNESSVTTKAQLVWLERPRPYKYDEVTGTPLDVDGTVFDPFNSRNTPWKVRVLNEGPDVMFSVADLDTTDNTIEVIASQFFNKKVTLHSIERGLDPKVIFQRTIDERCGASFSAVLADLEENKTGLDPQRSVLDSGSTVSTLKAGDFFSHLLVTSHECEFVDEDEKQNSYSYTNKESDSSRVKTGSIAIDGGSLFSYRVPLGKNAWKTEHWTRSVISTGFRVSSKVSNMINPGAPGFCYTFYPKKDSPKIRGKNSTRPLIGISGDCAEAAYILRPVENSRMGDPSANYALMCEIKCDATVGSIAIGYEDLCNTEQQSGYAKIYVPCFEKNKIFVIAMGNGEEEEFLDEWS
mmetsp:Transcript_15227/g.21716  ORF Transcript_15227/g.21716 Transcript_15227/m.21716 type:complete len:704 (-) Transcript_15227:49-2160(-)